MDFSVLIDEAITQHQAGRYERAVEIYDQVLKIQPDHVDALHLMGMAVHHRGDDDRAVDLIERAITIDPNQGVFYNTMGQVLRGKGQFAQADVNLRRAIELDPNLATAHHNLASVQKKLGRLQDAVACDRRAVQLQPGYANAHHGLADSLQSLNLLPDAITSYKSAIKINDRLVTAWFGMGCAQASLGCYADSVVSFRRAVDLDKNHIPSRHNLGQALFKLGQIDQALEHFRIANSNQQPLSLAAMAVVIPGAVQADHWAVVEARRAWANSTGLLTPLPPKSAPRKRPKATSRLRIGYLSSFFQNRNWMKPVWGLINRHDRQQFEVHLFSDAAHDQIPGGYQKHEKDHFHDTSKLSNKDLATLIQGNHIDILIDLNGYSKFDRLGVLALKPASVIVAWFNMYATSGLDCYDYLIGDNHVISADEHGYFTEQVVSVPGTYLPFEVTYPVPDIVSPPCKRNGLVTFGCLASQYKITTEVVEAWSQILAACPESKLILKNATLGSKDNGQFVHQLFAGFGIEKDRVVLSGPSEHFVFLEAYDQIDISLDTFPYNGGTTTMESLWQGVPMLTFRGDRWVSRTSASIMHNAGLSEYVARDKAEYVMRAVSLAKDPETPSKLSELRMGMRSYLSQQRVCDMSGFTKDMEKLYLKFFKEKS